MNITKTVVDDTNIVLSLEIEKADYAEAVEKALKDARRRIAMPGFRKGMVPAGLVKKMYGASITVDEVNRLINDSLYNYIRENKVAVLGEPMTQEGQKPFDEAAERYTINFDIAVAPAFDLKVDSSVKVPYYNITVGDEMMDRQIEGLRSQFGSDTSAETVGENDVLKGAIAELDADGNLKEGGIEAEETTLYPRYFKDDAQKALFLGAAKYASVDFDPAVASGGSNSEVASMLRITADEAKELVAGTRFRFTIADIMHHEPAAMNEDFFKQAYGEECTTEEQFRTAVREQIAGQLRQNSEYRFTIDVRNVLMQSVGTLKFPEERLKKWLLTKDEKRSAEQLDKDFPRMMEDLTWQLIEERIVAEQGITVTDDDIRQEARAMVSAQMAQYGMGSLPAEYLDQYAQSLLKDEKQRAQLRDASVTRKIMAYLRGAVALDEKEVTMEDFNKLFEAAE